MKAIDRIALIKQISKDLLQRMDIYEIEAYFEAVGCKNVPHSNDWDEVHFTKHVLNKAPDKILETIKSELGLAHEQSSKIEESTYWVPGYFRLFLSHVSSFKEIVSILQQQLKYYGISSFVAHEDISPSSEWQIEIEKSLTSMDALAAILSDGFDDSFWTDQEVGAAVGRQLLVIPVCKSVMPYGFISKYQALKTKGKTVDGVAKELYEIIIQNPKTRPKMVETLIGLFLSSTSTVDAQKWLTFIADLRVISIHQLEKIRLNVRNNSIISRDEDLITQINTILATNGVPTIEKTKNEETDDEIPF